MSSYLPGATTPITSHVDIGKVEWHKRQTKPNYRCFKARCTVPEKVRTCQSPSSHRSLGGTTKPLTSFVAQQTSEAFSENPQKKGQGHIQTRIDIGQPK